MPTDAQAVLKKALQKLTEEKLKIEQQIRAVQSALSGLGVMSPELAARRHRSPMTAAERRSVSKRMRIYWAKRRRSQKSR